MVTFEWTINEVFAGQMLRSFLREEKKISRTALTDIKFYGGSISVNGSPATVRYTLKEGDVVKVTFPPEKRSEYMEATKIALDIIYEDDHLLIINKQPHLPSIPSRLEPNYSLANGVLHYYDEVGITSTFHAVNRLDRDTSGLVLIAKHRYAHDLLSKQQKNGVLKRRYKALVHEVIREDKGTIDVPIGRKDGSVIERVVRSDGQRSVTHFQVIQRFNEATLVSCSLETGRTHQIRVHLSYLGHPLLGDDLYGGKRDLIARQALHSGEMTFYHPYEGEKKTFSIPLPADINAVISHSK